MATKKTASSHTAVSPIRAAIYMRVSTEDQATDGYGMDVQRTRCRAQIEAKGWHFIGAYEDAGVSGVKDEQERPALARLLQDAESGLFEAVVVLALDRLGRKTSLVLRLVERLSNGGVSLVSCKESLDTSTPQGQFVLTMFAALAQLERDVIVERTTAGRNERAKQDGERGGRLPMGYVRLPDNTIAIDSDRAAVVRRMFAMRDSGLSFRAIADVLNREGVKTMRRSTWHGSSVREVLCNEPAYRGGLRGLSQAVHWQPIL